MNALVSDIDQARAQRLNFYKKLRARLNQFNFKVYVDLDWTNTAERKFSVIGALKLEDLATLKQGIEGLGCRAVDVDTPHYQGIYFEGSTGDIGLFLAPKAIIITLDQRIHNSTRESENIYELEEFGKANQLENLAPLDFASGNPLWIQMDQLICETLGLRSERFFDIRAENSHREFMRYYLEYKNQQRNYHYNFESYNNNIQIFAWIYYWEIRIIGEVIGQTQHVSIHDAGTNVAQFPLLLSGLTPEQLYGVEYERIIASDNGWTGETVVKRIIENNPGYRPIEFIQADLIRDVAQLPRTDVLVINDVFEHLPTDAVAFNTLQELWEKTEHLLIAHVPLEEVPNPAWDHHLTFNPTKIRDWAAQLPGARLLSDHYSEDYASLTEHGFLIVAKQ